MLIVNNVIWFFLIFNFYLNFLFKLSKCYKHYTAFDFNDVNVENYDDNVNKLDKMSLILHKHYFKFMHSFKKAACEMMKKKLKKKIKLKIIKTNVYILKTKTIKCKIFNYVFFYKLKVLKMFYKFGNNV